MRSLELSDEENDIVSRIDRDNGDNENNGGYRSDEAEEDRTGDNADNDENAKARRIDPSTSKKRVVRNPQIKLNAERIQGPKGVQTIEKYFEGFKYQGKGHEKSDLDKIMKRLEHWAHRLFPKYQFDDFLEKMEVLGSKKNVQVYLKKYRLGMETPVVDMVDPEDNIGVERGEHPALEETPVDDFDKLIAEQIEKQRRVADQQEIRTNTSIVGEPSGNVLGSAKSSEMSDEIKARIEANRKLAIERKNARLKKIEDESKKRKLEESQNNSRVSDAQFTKEVFGYEKSKEIVSEKVQSTGDETSAMEISNDEEEKRVPTVQETFKEFTAVAEKAENKSLINDDLEILANGRNADTVVANKPGATKCKNISIVNIIEIPKGTFDVSKLTVSSNNNSVHRNELEDFSDHLEDSDVAKTYESTVKTPRDDPEKLLSKEELQKEIDNAIEEIINRNAHRNK